MFEASSQMIKNYNKYCLHYEIVANSCYRELENMESPFNERYYNCLVAALITFDMARQMGIGLKQKYDLESPGFGSRLKISLQDIKEGLTAVSCFTISSIDLESNYYISKITDAYNVLAERNLCEEKNFHVGATKILHFLFPDLFPIVDSNVARIMRTEFDVKYINSTQPGYCADKYLDSMRAIQKYINNFGLDEFGKLGVCRSLCD